VQFFSPAKINLFLRILRRREDGYHDLASLFQVVDLGDTIDLTFSDIDRLTCTDSTLPLDRSNLIWKAVDLFHRKTGLSTPLHIHLEKRIPIQAGIGGGSSNAATTLWALNQLYHTNVSDLELATWASEIGSDISFFFSHGRAYCTGRGEQIRELPATRLRQPLWLVKPPEGLSTPHIFKALNLSKCSKVSPEEILRFNTEERIYFLNDLEEHAFEVLPALRLLKEKLLSQGFQVSLTGSGTGLLCLGDKAPHVSSEIRTYPLHYLSREAGSWYSAFGI
jgi:4-diphosphocytidyl-2-C-methyl-D-erythritol kinase